MSSALELGSEKWRKHVFDSPPVAARSLSARPSVRNLPTLEGRVRVLEGANDHVAGYVLSYFKQTGALLRWKEKPFEWLVPLASSPSVPSFLAELAFDRQLMVIQTKGAKYLNASVAARFEEEKTMARAAGMLHVVWTDVEPLTAALRNLLFHLRRARHTVAAPNQIESLVDFVKAQCLVSGCCTINQLVAAGHDPALVAVAVNRALLHVPLDRALNGATSLTMFPQTDARDFLLARGSRRGSWWNSLNAPV